MSFERAKEQPIGSCGATERLSEQGQETAANRIPDPPTDGKGAERGHGAFALAITFVEEFPVGRRTKQFAAILCLVAMISITAWPVWKWLHPKPVSASLFERTKTVVEKNPRLQPLWDRAMQDGVLTWPEAKEILESAGEKAEPEE
jgi:hypothetical protein